MVTLRRANVRAGPSTDFERLDTLNAGAQVNVTGQVRERDWVRVAIRGGGVGYVWDQLLGQQEPEAKFASVATAEP